jgi:hypothetical protein
VTPCVELGLEELAIVRLADCVAKQLRTIERALISEELAERLLLILRAPDGQIPAHPADEPRPGRKRTAVVVEGDLGIRRDWRPWRPPVRVVGVAPTSIAGAAGISLPVLVVEAPPTRWARRAEREAGTKEHEQSGATHLTEDDPSNATTEGGAHA